METKQTQNTERKPFLGYQDLVTLEEIMTRSAFAHEYGLMELAKNLPYSRRELVLAQLEQYKHEYFEAREAMEQVDPDKLLKLEEHLHIQKETVLREYKTIH